MFLGSKSIPNYGIGLRQGNGVSHTATPLLSVLLHNYIYTAAYCALAGYIE